MKQLSKALACSNNKLEQCFLEANNFTSTSSPLIELPALWLIPSNQITKPPTDANPKYWVIFRIPQSKIRKSLKFFIASIGGTNEKTEPGKNVDM